MPALAHADSWVGLIVDGHHVHPEVLKIALRAKQRDRFMLVSDAMPSVGAETKSFEIQGRTITVDGDKIVDDEGRLAGAHLDMARRSTQYRQPSAFRWWKPCAWPAAIRPSS